jgi:PAS domain S-box-containing protein
VSLRILLAEKGYHFGYSRKKHLLKHNLDVLLVCTLHELRETLLTLHHVDVVVLDLELGPEQELIPILEEIALHRSLPIVLLTAYENPTLLERINECHFYGILPKEVGTQLLIYSISNAFSFHKSQFETASLREESETALEELRATNDELLEANGTIAWWEKLMREVIWHNPNATLVLNNNLHIVYVSQRFLQDYQVNQEDVIGKHHYEVFPDIPEKWRKVHQRALNGEVLSNQDDWFIREDGRKDYTSWVCRPWHHADGSIGGIIAYTEVLTKQKQIQKELAASEQKLRFLFNHVNQGIVHQDNDSRILDINPAAQRILGYTKEELLSSSSLDPRWYMVDENQDYVPGDDHPVMLTLKTHKPTGPVVRGIKHPDGHITWLSITAIPIFDSDTELIQGAYAVFEDITVLKQLNDSIAQNEAHFRTLFTELPIPITINDPKTGKVVGANQTALRNFKCKTVREMNKKFELVNTPPYSFEEARAKLKEVMVTGNQIIEWPFYDHKGKLYWDLVSMSRGTIRGKKRIIVAYTDITKQKHIEEELLRQNEEKQTILAETQHRIKNNFASIEALLALHADQDIHPQAIEALNEASGRVTNLRILYEKLLHSKELTRLELSEYLYDLSMTLVQSINSQFQPELTFDAVTIYVGPNTAFPLGAILVELITNSLKYAFTWEDKGFNTKPQKSADWTSRISVNLAQKLSKDGTSIYQLTVGDNGYGFDRKIYQKKNSSSFGLTLVRLMAEQLGGTWEMKSEPNQGTINVIEFHGE